MKLSVEKQRDSMQIPTATCLPSGRCWHSEPEHWRSPRWPVLREWWGWSSAHSATWQSRHHPSCTGHIAHTVHRALWHGERIDQIQCQAEKKCCSLCDNFFSLLTLGSGLAIGSSQGDNTFVDLNAHHHASLFEVLGEGLAIIGLLVHGLMEENDATNARGNTVVSGEEELAVQPPVLLSVLSIDALETLGHAA